MIILHLLLTLMITSLLAPEEPATIYDLPAESWINACSFVGEPFYTPVSMSCRKMYGLALKNGISSRCAGGLELIYLKAMDRDDLLNDEVTEARNKAMKMLVFLMRINHKAIKVESRIVDISQVERDNLEELKRINKIFMGQFNSLDHLGTLIAPLRQKLEHINEAIISIHNSEEDNFILLARGLRQDIPLLNQTWSRFQEEFDEGLWFRRVKKIYDAALGRANSVLSRF